MIRNNVTLHFTLTLLMILTTLLTTYLTSIIYAQEQVIAVPGCGQVRVVVCGPYSSEPKASFNVGEEVWLYITSTQPCQPTLTVAVISPRGVQTVPLRNVQIDLRDLVERIYVFSVTSQMESGQWDIVTVFTTATGTVEAPALTITIGAAAGCVPGETRCMGGALYRCSSEGTWVQVNPCAIECGCVPSWIYAAIGAAIAIAAIGGFIAYSRTRKALAPTPPPSPPPHPETRVAPPRPTAPETKFGTILYRLVLPNGTEIPVTETVKIFGRETFEKWGVHPDVLAYITREERGGHFKIYIRGNRWYIEDLNSTNGTLLNGREIKGKGPQELKDGDVISPGGVLNITFKLESSTQVYQT